MFAVLISVVFLFVVVVVMFVVLISVVFIFVVVVAYIYFVFPAWLVRCCYSCRCCSY